jgi:DNA-binding transcriptional regulator LsrR (DeoR family)
LWEEQVYSRRLPTTYPVPAAGVVGPDELFQRAVIARRYYLEGRTRVQIAEAFGLSRFKVARMLAALESGTVEI